MKTLVVGATGATGRLLVDQLLMRGHHVKAVVRSPDSLPQSLLEDEHLEVIRTNIAEAIDSDMVDLVEDCDAIASCLGHNLTFRGVFGKPRRLVTDAIRRLCNAASSSNKPKRFVLMNTAGNSNRDLKEPVSLAQGCVTALLRLAIPPHADNEMAADFLRSSIGQDHSLIEWSAVRPDSLTEEPGVTEYNVHSSPVRSAIFNAGKTSRINVAHFMAELITNDDIWTKWKGQMPVIYNGRC